jgi:Protein of unknown function (DUF2786)
MSAIHEKIQKLLALAERGGTEAEAQAAMTAAHALLAKHNLTISEVQAYGEEKPEDIVTDDSTPAPLRNQYWRDTIYCAIADLFFCNAFMRTRKKNRWYVVYGRPSNIQAVHYVAQSLIRTGETLATQEAKAAAQRMANDGVELNVRAWAASFRIGYAQRIRQRVKEEINKAKRGEVKDETGTALILSPLYDREQNAIATIMQQHGIKLTNSRSSVNVRSSSGYQAGKEAGNRASFARNGLSSGGAVKSLPAA